MRDKIVLRKEGLCLTEALKAYMLHEVLAHCGKVGHMPPIIDPSHLQHIRPLIAA